MKQKVSTKGGYGNNSQSAVTCGYGGAGTIYLSNGGLVDGDLIVDNGGAAFFPANGVTDLLSTSVNSSLIYSTPDANTAQITSASSPLANLAHLFKGQTLQLFLTTDPANPLDASHQVAILTGNTANDFLATGNPFPAVAASDHYYRIVHRFDHLDIAGNARVVATGADVILNSCDLHSAAATIDVPAGSSLTGNSLASGNCTNAAVSAEKGVTVNFTGYFLQ